MRFPASRLLSLTVLLAGAAACAPALPPPPFVAQAGWSWEPSIAADRPLPVVWWGTTEAELLPVLSGDCSGTVQAMASLNAGPLLAGISVSCDASGPVMRPITWAPGTYSALPLPGTTTQGTALAIAEANGKTYVGGAAGTSFPMPMLWIDGAAALDDPSLLLPDGTDAGLIMSIVPTRHFLVAAGMLHLTDSSPPRWIAAAWFIDFDFTSAQVQELTLPAGSGATGYGPSVSVAYQLDTDTLWAASSVNAGAGTDKPFVWMGSETEEILPLDFTTGPFGSLTGLVPIDETPYVSGWQRDGSTARVVPMLWAGTAPLQLPTAAAGGWGAAEGVSVDHSTAYVAGETTRIDPTSTRQVVAVPAYWANGVRTDLQPLSAPTPGVGPTLSEPFHGWWRLPGTPVTAPPDWPYPGGFPLLLQGPPVSAGGSGVARAILTIPKS